VREPDHIRAFKAPCLWLVAPLGALASFGLMCALPAMTWLRLIVWFAIGMVFYFTYSVKHSKLRDKHP
jgi:APA family basic amino acid/polyamine antiporter